MWVDQLPHCAPMVHPYTMEQIVQVESGGNPLAINVNGLSAKQQPHPHTTAEAVAVAHFWIHAGYRVDLGLSQITDRNLPKLHLTIEQVLGTADSVVCTNIAAGGAILAADYGRAVQRYGEGQPALQAALSAYNTGTFDRGFSNGYVSRYLLTPSRPAKVVARVLPVVARHAADTEVW
jgi:type IV secretion system protein VirB1